MIKKYKTGMQTVRFFLLVALAIVLAVVFETGRVWAQVQQVVTGYSAFAGSDNEQSGEISQAKKVTVQVVAGKSKAMGSNHFVLGVVLDIKQGYHLYANPKRGEFGIDTKIEPQATAGLRFGKVIYPVGIREVDKVLNASNNIYKGRAVCYVPVTISDTSKKNFAVKLKLSGQLCSDAGTCELWDDKVQTQVNLSTGLVNIDTQAGSNAQQVMFFKGLDVGSVVWNEMQGVKGENGAQGKGRTKAIAGTASEKSTGGTKNRSGAHGAKEAGKFSSDEWVLPILAAFAMGVIFNLMPCIWPILPIIIMTLMKQCTAEEGHEPDRAKSIRTGLAFAGGVMTVFIGLGILMAVFNMMWGEMFQITWFKFVLLVVVYLLTLSTFGMFEIVLPSSVSNISVVRGGYLGAFAMGMLATVLGTPCGAGLLSVILAWTASKPAVVTIIVFIIMGTGMGMPYVLLTSFPKLLNRMPRAGNWMLRLKQIMGFMMLGFSVWLLSLFPPVWQVPLLYFCVLMGFCVWMGFTAVNHSTPATKRTVVRFIALLLVVLGGLAMQKYVSSKEKEADHSAVSTVKWYEQLANYKKQGRSVIVKFTANWCKNCAEVKHFVYDTPEFKKKLRDTNTALIIVDMSYGDARAKKMTQELGGPGQPLPFAVVFPGGRYDRPITLSGLYSLQDAMQALDKAYKIEQQAKQK